jgi:hypothetical protein
MFVCGIPVRVAELFVVEKEKQPANLFHVTQSAVQEVIKLFRGQCHTEYEVGVGVLGAQEALGDVMLNPMELFSIDTWETAQRGKAYQFDDEGDMLPSVGVINAFMPDDDEDEIDIPPFDFDEDLWNIDELDD